MREVGDKLDTFSFAVVIFRIIKSALSLPRHSFINCRFSIPFQTWTLGQFNFFSGVITVRISNATLLAVYLVQRRIKLSHAVDGMSIDFPIARY